MMGIIRVGGKYFDEIEGAVVMMEPQMEQLISQRHSRFRWEAFLPRRKAWLQTLILLPFGLPVANFLASSLRFAINAIVEDRQYLIGIISIAVNLLLPSLVFAFVFHWGWFVWRQTEPTWYPQIKALRAGGYATLTIAVSFGIVGLFTQTLGICENSAWGAVGQTLLCNLDGYGFESKSWFGAWFIIAAYCYRALDSIESSQRSGSASRFIRTAAPHEQLQSYGFPEDPMMDSLERADFASAGTIHRDSPTHEDLSVNSIETRAELGSDI
jgi:hypothetical protein